MGKALGIGMIFAACMLFAYGKVQDMKQKLVNLLEMERALFLMRHEISFSGRELWEACNGLASALSGPVSDLFFQVSDRLQQEETLSFQEAFSACAPGLFSPEAKSILGQFAATFGTLSKELEESAIMRCMESLSRLKHEEQEAYKKNRKLIYALCMGAGVAVLILLI